MARPGINNKTIYATFSTAVGGGETKSRGAIERAWTGWKGK